MKKVVAITGVIGSGKSAVSDYLRSKGFFVADCDALSRQVAEDSEVLKKIEEEFGTECVSGGMLNRRVLAAKTFCDSKKTEALNAIFHPRIKDKLRDIVDSRDGLIFVEIPLLEDDFKLFFDEIWVVTADRQTVKKRVAKRDNREERHVEDILNRQKRYEYNDSATFVSNDGTLAELYEKVEKLLSAY